MKKRINIEGMSCNHCVMHVKNALSEVAGVKSVEVSLEGKYALVDVEGASDDAMKAAVEDAGYDVISIVEA
ncbi:heavy-metal-associated domain-containing protein [Fonticella tunisiensis]|uniref:Copper ion binding protein n=1 Tax=Fonticella tunisiensis TaxID=1096341 RepID=A0A4R7KMG0_9CLOT|nr:cation transporter [Fonticella tunisiensis]TDT57294.1 copper ion binding protein [Fonticella tunisiensis]